MQNIGILTQKHHTFCWFWPTKLPAKISVSKKTVMKKLVYVDKLFFRDKQLADTNE